MAHTSFENSKEGKQITIIPWDVMFVICLVEEYIFPVNALGGMLLKLEVLVTIQSLHQIISPILHTCKMPSGLMPCSLQSFFQNSNPIWLLPHLVRLRYWKVVFEKSPNVATSESCFREKSQSPPDCHIAPAGASPSHKACCLFDLDLRFSQEM